MVLLVLRRGRFWPKLRPDVSASGQGLAEQLCVPWLTDGEPTNLRRPPGDVVGSDAAAGNTRPR